MTSTETSPTITAPIAKKSTVFLFNSKHNPKIDTNSIFIKGKNIIDEISKIKLVHIKPIRSRYRRTVVSNHVSIPLDGSFSKVDIVPGLKTTLYRHQQTTVKAMLDLEYKRSYTQNTIGSRTYKIAYNVAVLSEPVGSGKTIDILAVICLSRIPRPVPDIMELKTMHNNLSVGFIRCRFKNFLKPTIIFVGSSVMKQWSHAINQFTELKTYCVNSVIELKKMFDMVANKTINQYNVILVKNGKITVPITLPNGIKLEKKNKVSQPYFYNLIANLRSYCWARVVVDDFDTIKLPHNAGIVRGIFTWYISSTRKKMDTSSRGSNKNSYQLASDWVQYHDYGCSNIMYNNYLFENLNVRNGIDYLKSTTDMPCPKYHVSLFKNPNDRYISLLISMGESEINRITEMLNGDAISAAADAAGIKSKSVADIFSSILGDKYKSYRFAGDMIEFIDYQVDKEDERLPMTQNLDSDDHYGKKDLLNFRDIGFKYPGVKGLLNTSSDEYTEVKKNSGLAIQRVKDNIKHGTCPVCYVDLEDGDEVIIVKCCNAVFCGKCGIDAQSLNDRYKKLKNGRCSNCRAVLTIKDLIYIGDDIDIADVAEEVFDDEDSTELVDDLSDNIKINSGKRTKYTALIDIINGESVIEDRRVDLHIPNMMKGANYLPEVSIRKVLIFANFEETLQEVVKVLDTNKILYWRLAGGVNEIADTSFKFTECKKTCAMVINSSKHCAGLNLQTATDLVFAHRMIDQAVESQVAGRGHRLGRTSPLNIWYLMYENEYTELKVSHSVRELTDIEIKQERAREAGTEKALINTVRDNAEYGFTHNK
jgi:hypothetical protein